MPTATPFNNLITFSRGSNATVTGSNGLIQWAPNNLLTFSEQFDNAAWGKTGLGTGLAPVVTPNVVVAPDGTTTADLVAFNRGAGNAIGDRSTLSQLPTILNGYAYAATIYIKAATTGDVGKQLAYRGVAGVGYQVITLTADWVRITTVETSTGTAGNFELASRGTVSADNQVSVHLWGAQLELGSTATTYNPTTVKNLLGFSEAFDNAGWSKLNTSIVTGAQANPVNGLFNAQKLMEDTANAQHIVQQGFSVLSGTPYVFSVYAKAAGRNRFSFRFGSIAPADSVTFDLSNGTIVTGTAGYVASIVSIGSGWYRCSITSTPSSSGTRQHQIYLNSTSGSGAETYTGDGNSGVYIYGAQLSDSASLDPYVPTPGAAPSSTAFYGPRFDFDPVTLQPRGLLVEEQRTNLTTYSEQFDNVAWAKNNVQIVPNQDPAAATLGAELCINGDFASATGWTANAGWVISGGQATGTATSSSLFGGQMTTIAGRVYRVDFDVVSYTSGDLLVTVGANYDGQVRLTGMSAGRRTVYVVGGTVTTRGVEFYGGSVTCSIDNVSVREVIGGALIAPDGTASADTILATNTAVAGLVRSFASTAVAYTYSVYLKQGNTTFSEIEIIDQGTVANRVRLTYATGVLTVVSGSPTGTAASVGNGWWRVTITYTFPAIGAADTLVIYPSTTTGSIGQYCFAWGAQLEAGAFATSYIPTVASTVTRSADVATISGQNFAQWFTQPQGSFVMEASSLTISGVNFLLTASDGTTNNRFGFYRSSAVIGGYVVNGGTTQMDITSGTVVVGTPFKSAVAATANDGNFSFNGNIGATDTSIVMPALNQMGVGNSNGSGFHNGHIRNIRFIPARAADFQLQGLST